MSGIEERIAEVLYQHGDQDTACRCGFVMDYDQLTAHAEHVAAVLVAELGLTRSSELSRRNGVDMSMVRYSTRWEPAE